MEAIATEGGSLTQYQPCPSSEERHINPGRINKNFSGVFSVCDSTVKFENSKHSVTAQSEEKKKKSSRWAWSDLSIMEGFESNQASKIQKKMHEKFSAGQISTDRSGSIGFLCKETASDLTFREEH